MIGKLFRWLFRIGALCIFAGVVSILPRVMPGVPWLHRVVWFCGLVIAVDLAGLVMLATLIPRGDAVPRVRSHHPIDWVQPSHSGQPSEIGQYAKGVRSQPKEGGPHAG